MIGTAYGWQGRTKDEEYLMNAIVSNAALPSSQKTGDQKQSLRQSSMKNAA